MERTLYGRKPPAKVGKQWIADDIVACCGMEGRDALPTFKKPGTRLALEVHMGGGQRCGTWDARVAFRDKLSKNVTLRWGGRTAWGRTIVSSGASASASGVGLSFGWPVGMSTRCSRCLVWSVASQLSRRRPRASWSARMSSHSRARTSRSTRRRSASRCMSQWTRATSCTFSGGLGVDSGRHGRRTCKR